jgi:hypothetical protein
MARGSSKGGGSGGGPSRVRFIMLDADLNDGDLTQITQAIQNALRPQSNGPPARVPQQIRLPVLPPTDEEITVSPEGHIDEPEVVVDEQPRAASGSREPRPPRKFRTPQVLTDVDLNSPVSFFDYAKDRNLTSDRKKYLAVAAWFKEHRGVDAISADHVYTCFRAIKWNTQIDDFQAPLRALKRDQFMGSTGRGLFAINHLGLAEVDNHD